MTIERRLLTTVSLLATCAFALSACGSDTTETVTSTATTTSTASTSTDESTDATTADTVSSCSDINSEDYEVSVRNISCEKALAMIPSGDETPLTDAGWTCEAIETYSDHIVRRCSLGDMAIRYSSAQEGESQETTGKQGSEGTENDGPSKPPGSQGSEGPEIEAP